MEADSGTVEALAAMGLVGAHDADGGAATDAIEVAVGVEDGLQSEGRQQALVEGQAGVVVADRQHDVGNAVDLHARVLLGARRRRQSVSAGVVGARECRCRDVIATRASRVSPR
jgi:hypothetical protein